MSKYYKAGDVIRKRAENLADTSYWEYGNPKNVDEWVEVAEMEFKDLPTIEVSEDCISREVATDIIKNYDFEFPQYMERFVTELRDAMKKDLIEDINNAPRIVPMFEDCISREWVLEEFQNGKEKIYEPEYFAELMWLVKHAPSVVPICQKNRQVERAEGEWIDNGNPIEIMWKCSECGEVEIGYNLTNFCPNCGAKMKGAEE